MSTFPLPPQAASPGFRLAVDADAVGALLTRHLLVDAELLELCGDYVRWKDQDGSLVGYRAVVRTGTQTTATYFTVRSAAPHRLADEAERLAHHDDETFAGARALVLVPEANVLLLGFPLDRTMPDLRRLVRGSKLRNLVASACPEFVPAGLRLSKRRSTFTLARYKPERRAVLHWQVGCVDAAGDRHEQRSLWLRCHAEPTARHGAAACRAAAAAGIATPTPLAVVHDRLALESHLAGSGWPVHEVERQTMAAAAAVTARLHGARVPAALPLHGPVQELDRALRAAADLGRLCPELHDRALRLTDHLAASVPASGGLHFAHGDLHQGQFLFAGSEAALCDFDRAVTAPVAFDLASFHAHCVLATPGSGHLQSSAFAAAYGRAAPLPPHEEQRWWNCAALLRSATTPFRRLQRDWPRAIAALLTRAEHERLAAAPEAWR